MRIDDYEKVMNLNNYIVMAGDINSKHTNWGCRLVNPNGNKLQTFITGRSYTVSARYKTAYFPTDSNRLLDILGILIIKSIPHSSVHEPLAGSD